MSLENTEDIVLYKYEQKWIKEQAELHKSLYIRDRHTWVLPPTSHVIVADEYYTHVGTLRPPTAASASNASNSNAPEEKKEASLSPSSGTAAGSTGGAGGKKKKNRRHLRYVAGVDISPAKGYTFEEDQAVAGLVICEYPSMRVVHSKMQLVRLTQPYIAGFLAFREAEHLVRLIEDVKKNHAQYTPDLILVDGNGILHFRRMGLASHLGVLVKIPTVGVAKKLLQVNGIRADTLMHKYNNPLKYPNDPVSKYMVHKGGFCKIGANIRTGNSNKYEVIGVALKTKENDDVVYVSIGHRVSLFTAMCAVMDCCRNNKLPFPIHEADRLSRVWIRNYERNYKNPYAHNLYQNTREYNRGVPQRTDGNVGTAGTAGTASSGGMQSEATQRNGVNMSARGEAAPMASAGNKKRKKRRKKKKQANEQSEAQ